MPAKNSYYRKQSSFPSVYYCVYILYIFQIIKCFTSGVQTNFILHCQVQIIAKVICAKGDLHSAAFPSLKD